MTEDRYLILHKCRGEPQWDVAIQQRFGDGDGWIVESSGHRAYPIWTEPLNNFVRYQDNRVTWVSAYPSGYGTATVDDLSVMEDHHMPTRAAPAGVSLENLLGIAKPLEPIRRI